MCAAWPVAVLNTGIENRCSTPVFGSIVCLLSFLEIHSIPCRPHTSTSDSNIFFNKEILKYIIPSISTLISMAEVMHIATQAAAAGGPPDPPKGPPDGRRPPEGAFLCPLERTLIFFSGPSDLCPACKRRHRGPCKLKCERCKRRHLGRCTATCRKCRRWGHHHTDCPNERVQKIIVGVDSGGDRDLAHRTTAKMPPDTMILWNDWRAGEDDLNTLRNRRKRAAKVIRRRAARDRQRSDVDTQVHDELDLGQEQADPSGPYMTLAMRPKEAETSEGEEAEGEHTSEPEPMEEDKK